MQKKVQVVPKLRREAKIKVDIVTSDDIKIYYTGKFQDFTARYIIKVGSYLLVKDLRRSVPSMLDLRKGIIGFILGSANFF